MFTCSGSNDLCASSSKRMMIRNKTLSAVSCAHAVFREREQFLACTVSCSVFDKCNPCPQLTERPCMVLYPPPLHHHALSSLAYCTPLHNLSQIEIVFWRKRRVFPSHAHSHRVTTSFCIRPPSHSWPGSLHVCFRARLWVFRRQRTPFQDGDAGKQAWSCPHPYKYMH